MASLIEVHGHGCNWISLQGEGIDSEYTSIALHRTGWEIEVGADGFGIVSGSARTREGVLHKLDELLAEVYLTEYEIAREELIEYMDRVILYCENEHWTTEDWS